MAEPPPDDLLVLSSQETEKRLKEIEEFLPTLVDLQGKLQQKKEEAHKVIRQKMKDLHHLIDKWESRFLDTASETIDEKIEGLSKQSTKLKTLSAFVRADKIKQDNKDPEEKARDADREKKRKEAHALRLSQRGEDDDDDDDDEEENKGDEERKRLLHKFATMKMPLQPDGASIAETKADLWNEFGNLLDESRKSLKRSLLLVGGIVRGYMRRGQKKDEWVKIVRRLESRFENSERPQAMDLSGPLPTISPSLHSDYPIYNTVWKAVSDTYKYRDNLTLRDSLCKQLSTLHEKHPAHLEFYLPQLVNVWLIMKDFDSLGDFILSRCSVAPDFAVQVYFFVCSMGQVGPPKWQKRCFKVLKKILKAVPFEDGTLPPKQLQLVQNQRMLTHSGESPPVDLSHPLLMSMSPPEVHVDSPLTHQPAPSASIIPITHPISASSVSSAAHSETTSERRKSAGRQVRTPKPHIKEEAIDPETELAMLTRIEPPSNPPHLDQGLPIPAGKEYFLKQIEFMRGLIDISRKLGEIYGKKELYKPRLDEELKELESYIKSGTAFMPHLHSSRLRVLKICLEDSSPIPTYGRVLYRMVYEAVDIPQHYTKKMVDEYLKLSHDIAEVDADKPSLVPSSSASSLEVGPKQGSVFGESWKEVRKRMKAKSEFGALPHWEAKSVIVKHGDFVLQEQFVMQLIIQFQKIWEQEGIPLRLVSYRIMALSYQSGLIEVVPNAVSMDKLKTHSEARGEPNLLDFFRTEWPHPRDFERARTHFVSSLAAYSIICYLLQIKDRHNGNIMLDSEGVLFHIDFGYLLARTIKFEKAPFKLTDEFVEVMGGDQSKYFKDFVTLCVRGFIAARKHYEKILLLVEMTMSESAAIPCLERDSITKNLRKRFHLEWNEAQLEEYVISLIFEARDNWRTQLYDTYQRILNDIH